MNRTLFAATAVVLSLAGAARADDDHVGLVKNVSGHVHIVRQGASLDAQPGATLFVADRVVSDAGSAAGIVFRDGTLITLGASADVQVRDYVFEPKEARYAFSAYLAKGTAIYESGRLAKLSPDAVKIGTPTATVGVRGTRFVIQAD